MIYDQLHVFPDRATAEAAFGNGKDEDGRQMAAWMHGDLTVFPCAIALAAPEIDTADPESGAVTRGTRPADGYWMGVATHIKAAADAAQAMATCRVAYIRPDTPTPWREAITWAAKGILDLQVVSAMSFAGSGYVFD